MKDKDTDPRLDALKDRIEENAPKPPKEYDSKHGSQAGMELVASIFVSTAIGIGLDKWLGTLPLFLLIFFFLGIATGFYNVYRITNDLGTAVGIDKNNRVKDLKGDTKDAS